MNTKTVAALLFSFFLLGCSGYRYSLIEDDKRYLLQGQFCNNNPFIKVKAIISHNYIIEKTNQKIAKEQDISQFIGYDTPRKDGSIFSGYIEDKNNAVVIKLMIKDGETGVVTEAIENGTYKLQNRTSVADICTYIYQKYSWIGNNKKLKRDLKDCGLSTP